MCRCISDIVSCFLKGVVQGVGRGVCVSAPSVEVEGLYFVWREGRVGALSSGCAQAQEGGAGRPRSGEQAGPGGGAAHAGRAGVGAHGLQGPLLEMLSPSHGCFPLRVTDVPNGAPGLRSVDVRQGRDEGGGPGGWLRSRQAAWPLVPAGWGGRRCGRCRPPPQ